MAYVLKYQSDFYNVFRSAVSIQLYQESGTSGHIHIRTKSVTITTNYQGSDVPTIGVGAKIVFVNEGAFQAYDSLLMNYEKQWKVLITYGTYGTIFEGFLICDLNEQQLVSSAEITLQFTNYVRRLEDVYLSYLADTGQKKNILSIIHAALTATGLGYDVYVNSTLFEAVMDKGATDCFLPQSFVDGSIFGSSDGIIDSAYTVLNKILKPFQMFVYSYRTGWFIERYQNIDRDTTETWVQYNPGILIGDSAVSQVVTLNKQAGDFKYIDTSQVLQYDSGAKILKVSLNEKIYPSLIFDNYSTGVMPTVSELHITPTDLALYRTWYMSEAISGIVQGNNYRNIDKYMTFTVVTDGGHPNTLYYGVYHKFVFQTNQIEIDGVAQKTTISLSYKVPLPLVVYYRFSANFICSIRGKFQWPDITWKDDSGWPNPLDDSHWLAESTDTLWLEYVNYAYLGITEVYLIGSLNFGAAYHILNKSVVPANEDTGVVNVDASFPFDNLVRYYADLIGTGLNLYQHPRSLPDVIEMSFGFLPSTVMLAEGSSEFQLAENTLGDIICTATTQTYDNEIENEININFVKTEDIGLDIFDLKDENYVNGVSMQGVEVIGDGYIRTSLWGTDGATYTKSLVDLLVESRMQKLAQTTRKLVATLFSDKCLKPFSVITDYDINNAVVIPSTSHLIDKDGNTYHSIRIGNLEILVENLKTEHYADGTAIPILTDSGDWWDQWDVGGPGAMCYYNNDANNKAAYGALYNWYALLNAAGLVYLTRDGIRESGWRVMTSADIVEIQTALGGESVAGGAMKETGTTHWTTPNTGASNTSGFTGVGAGYRNGSGYFSALQGNMYVACSNVIGADYAVGRLGYLHTIFTQIVSEKGAGTSVRLVRTLVDPIKFVLTQDTWNLNNGTHDIEAEEYPATEITITTTPIP